MFRNEVQFSILSIYLSLQISKLELFRLYSGSPVLTSYKNSPHVHAERVEAH